LLESAGKNALSPVLIPLLAALLLTGGAPALAGEGVRLSGFGTLGYARDDRADLTPTRDISQLPKVDYEAGSWKLDSRLGVQLEYGVSPAVDLVGQVVLRDHFKADLNSSTELAYAAIRPGGQFDLRVGRVNYDAFLMSDHRNVGYAYAWVRPPTEFYGWIPIFSVNGMDAAYHFRAADIFADDARWRIKAQAGSSTFSIPVAAGREGGYEFTTRNLASLSLTRQAAFWRVKAAHSRFTIGSEVPVFAPLHQGLDGVAAASIPGVSAEAADLRRHLSFDGARISYTTLGAAYDDGVWVAQGELGYTTASSAAVPHGRMAYVSGGRRFGDWMPFALLSTSRPGNGVRGPANDWGALNAVLRDPALNIVNTTRIEQDTLSAGARWDFHHQAALKLQWDRSSIPFYGYGLWNRYQGNPNPSRRVDLYSVTLDFVF
jgi:hypothetical protein